MITSIKEFKDSLNENLLISRRPKKEREDKLKPNMIIKWYQWNEDGEGEHMHKTKIIKIANVKQEILKLANNWFFDGLAKPTDSKYEIIYLQDKNGNEILDENDRSIAIDVIEK